MASQKINEILSQAATLTQDETLELIGLLADHARHADEASERFDWRDAKGIAPYPLFGEDAQAWVTRTRQECQ